MSSEDRGNKLTQEPYKSETPATPNTVKKVPAALTAKTLPFSGSLRSFMRGRLRIKLIPNTKMGLLAITVETM